MLTSKQRAYLRSMANTMDPILFIGKEGVTDATAKEAYDALEARELIKGTVQQNCEFSAKEALELLCEKVHAEPCSASAAASCSIAGAVSPRSNCRDGNGTADAGRSDRPGADHCRSAGAAVSLCAL